MVRRNEMVNKEALLRELCWDNLYRQFESWLYRLFPAVYWSNFP